MTDCFGRAQSPLPVLLGRPWAWASAAATLALCSAVSGVDAALRALGGCALMALSARVRVHVPGLELPLTGQSLGAVLCGFALGPSLGTLATSIYLTLALFRVPILAEGGHAPLSAVSAAYVLGFVLCAFVAGVSAPSANGFLPCAFVAAAAQLCCVGVGAGLGMMGAGGASPVRALQTGVLPFLPGLVLKSVAAAATAHALKIV
mmetsp:Transcript_24786/g.81063  ORF Transcript_24786/g.81063 Transcript_24786/m.81063 type:complete len:205 (+) Transcript_24786:958-1572(+)